jgi:type II secretory pathway pseudopilin PulG
VKKQFEFAFSLVELTLALGIAAFCLIAVFALVPIAVLANRNATSQTAATNIIAAVVADLRATPATNSTSSQFGITFGTCRTLYFSSEGQVVASGACGPPITPPPNSRYQLNLTWNLTGSCSPTLPCADLKVTWPAAATPANPTGSTEVSAAFGRN